MSADQEDSLEFDLEPDDDELPEELTESQLNRISLSSTDWTTETVLNQMERGNIELSPRFQRRDAWLRNRKSRFIESLMLNLPVPQIVLAERQEERGRFLVLDGKQRLTALLKFSGKAAPGENLNGFTLTDMEILQHLNGRSFSDLMSNDDFKDELDALLNQTIRTVVIRSWGTDALLHLIFVRLNTSSVPLSPQELRQALYPGDFVNYIDDRAFNSGVLKEFMGLKHADFRMRDVEILLRFVSFHFFLDRYSGNMSKFLNDATEMMNELFESDRAGVEYAVDGFEAGLDVSMKIFGPKHVARAWNGERYESSRNRAILDVLLFYFSDPAVRHEALLKKERVESAYKSLFEDEYRFRFATISTTKSLTATRDRFVLWGEALTRVLDSPIAIPAWNAEKNRLVVAAD